jgi:hypothetical protein
MSNGHEARLDKLGWFVALAIRAWPNRHAQAKLTRADPAEARSALNPKWKGIQK